MLLIMTNTAKNTKKTEQTCLSSLEPHGINVWSFMMYFISFCPQDVVSKQSETKICFNGVTSSYFQWGSPGNHLYFRTKTN